MTEPLEQKPVEQKVADPKSVVSVVVSLMDDGKRVIAYQSDTQDKDKIHLAQVRELLQYALTHVNDSIMLGMIRKSFDEASKTRIVQPGFRPMSVLKKVFGQ